MAEEFNARPPDDDDEPDPKKNKIARFIQE